jgi:NADH-quinone oxidoreductase subunit N
MNQVFEGPAIDWFALSPLLVLVGGALTLLLVGSLTPQWPRGGYGILAATTLGASAVLSGLLWVDAEEPRTLIGDSLLLDRYALFAMVAMIAATLLSVLTANDFLEREGNDAPEPYGLMLTALIGGVAMVMANDLLVMFLGLETLSLSFYLLAASDRRRTASGEAGLKYFILGGFASAFFLYGVAMLFGVTGTTNIQSMAGVFAREVSLTTGNAMLLAGVALVLVGFAFKVSLVPFHVWTPDVYQGAPTPFTGFMASVGKIVAFAALVRVFTVALATRADDWRPAVWLLAVITLIDRKSVV